MILSKQLKGYIPHELHNKTTCARACLGLVFVLLLVAQLFTFEKFPGVINDSYLPGGHITAKFLAIFIVTLEVLALPFLFSLKTNHSVIAASRLAVLAATVGWFMLQAWAIGVGSTQSGLFGATVYLPAGIWAMVFTAMLVISGVFCVYGVTRFSLRLK